MADERLGTESLYSRILKKPEFTSVVGVLGVFLVFFMIAEDAMFTLEGVLSWTEQAALIGIIAVGACLLMIGGEFDLSVGSMIGFSGIIMAIMTVEYGIPAWISIITAFIIASGIGFLNGYIVVKTKLPSFIVTLASLFILRGLTVAISRLLTDQTLVGGVKEASEGDWLASLFGGEAFTGLFTYFAEMGMIATYDDGTPVVTGIKMLLVWWIALTVIGVVILRLTKYGNWIYATGGDEQASKNM